MSHGDIVTLTKDGIVAHEKSFRSVGIYDQSVCFGLWVGNPYQENDCDGNRLPPQLIVSPFHPFSWASLLRIRILINNTKGSLYRITKFLSDNDLSILYSECIPSGFGHAIWHVIAESTTDEIDTLKREKEDFDRKHSHTRSIYGSEKGCEECEKLEAEGKTAFEVARDLANRFAVLMLKHSGNLKIELGNLKNAEAEIKRIKRLLKNDKVTDFKRIGIDSSPFYRSEPVSLERLFERLTKINKRKHLEVFLEECIRLKVFLPKKFYIESITHNELDEKLKKLKDEDLKRIFRSPAENPLETDKRLTSNELLEKVQNLSSNPSDKGLEELLESEELVQVVETLKHDELLQRLGSLPPDKLADKFKHLPDKDKEKLELITPVLHDWETFKELPDEHFLYDTRYVLEEIRRTTPDWNDRDDSYFYRGAYKPIRRVRYQMDMAFFSIYGGGRDVPILLKYDATRSLLKPLDEQAFAESEWKGVIDVPVQFITNFDTQSKFIRLLPIKKPLVKTNLTNIDIAYKISVPKGKVAIKSKGLMSLVCEALQAMNINLIHSTNKNTRFDYSSHTGVMSFIADVDINEKEKIRSAINQIHHGKYTTIGPIDIYPNPTKKLFLSLHFGHPRDKQIRKMVGKVAQERGYESAIVYTHVDPVTDKVEEQIKSCDVFLQILTFKEHEIPSDTHFSWLDFEYGVAFGGNMPTLRLIDIVRLPFEEWEQKTKINKDQRSHEFRTDVSDKRLESYIRAAIEELDTKLLKKESV